MTSTADGFTSRLVRGFVQLAGLVAALAGVITSGAGWQHGHSLTTLGLAGVIIGGFNWKVNRRRRLAAVYAWHLELAMRQSDTKGALTAASLAVHHWRKLAAKRPIENQWLGPLLDQQWDLLHESGRHEEALPVAREAVETWRQLQADEPGYTEHLARSLNRVAVTLGRLDREEEAIPFTTEAISIRRRLVALDDQALGLDLSNLAISLIDGEQWERALPAAEEALEIHRRLATADAELQASASQDAERMWNILYHLERPDDLLRETEAWVDYERGLAADDPDRVPELAEAVRMLGSTLMVASRVPEGKAHWYESLELRRQFSEGSDEARSDYAAACQLIGRGLGSLRDDEEALAVFHDGLAVRRALVEVDDEQREGLVMDLADTALRFNEFDQPELALQFSAEGLAICREHPDSTSSYVLFRSLQELAAAHRALGELEPAAALGDEALVLLEKLTECDTKYAHHLIASLEEHAVLLHRLGRSDDARHVELKGVRLRENLTSDADQ
jgi:tetratricopeptide (TPR) repeat protein